MSLPKWFQHHADELKAARPKWARGLPEIVMHSGEIVPEDALPWIFGAAVYVEKEAVKHDLLEDLRRHADATSLDVWMSAALTAWIAAKAPARDAWLLAAVPTLAGSESVKVLDTAIRAWARAKERQLALRAVDVLGRINVREVKELMPVLALCVRDHSVSDEAGRLQNKQAAATGLSKQAAGDQAIPTLGLSARGERVLDFDQRKFTAKLNEKLEFELLDQAGNIRASIPSGTAKDDPVKVQVAKEIWSDLRTGVKRIIRVQSKRLEDSMVHGDVWTLADFQRVWLIHPILARLARSLLWQVAGVNLRITEDNSFATLDDEPATLSASATMRVLHPLELGEAELEKWRSLFADYQIFQVIPQLAREQFRPAEGQETSQMVKVPPHQPIKGGVLYGILDNDGWRLSMADGGLFRSSWKSFRKANVTALLSYSGLVVGEIAKSPDQSLLQLVFHSGFMNPEMTLKPGPLLRLAEVPSVAYSESLRRMSRLIASTTI